MPPKKDAELARKISENIRRLRKRKFPGHGGALKAARAFGVSPTHWCEWESGRLIPSDGNQRRLAEFFEVGAAELRGDAPPASASAEPSSAGSPVDIALAAMLRAHQDERLFWLREQEKRDQRIAELENELARRDARDRKGEPA